MSEVERDAVWESLPARLTSLAVRVRLLPWIREELVDWVRDSIVGRQGTWTVGIPGAVAEFPSASIDPVDVSVESGIVKAKRSDAAIRIAINEKIRAFAFSDDGPIVLGLPKGRAILPSNSVLQLLGPDRDAIEEARRGDLLFDIGICRQYTRFCVRTNDVGLISSLSEFHRRPWTDFMPAMLDQFLAVSPHRIVESAAARIEVFAPIPGPGQSPPNGAHTHFLPEYLKSGEEIAAGLTLPDYAAPIAVFYPHRN